MFEMLPPSARDKDLTKALVSSVLAAILMGYVVSVSAPRVFHAVLAVVVIGLVIAAYLFVARAKVDRDWQTAAIVGFGVIGFIILQALSKH